nr:MAG TPA: LAGLIDADG-like domain [Caudoviricetes sp.]
MGKKLFSESDKKYISEHYLTESYKDIGDKLGYTARQVQGWVNNHFKGKIKIREFNSDYFKYIDCPAKAYWLGFLYADGWVVYNEQRRNYECSIQLQAGDLAILQDLNNRLGGIHHIEFRHKEFKILNNSEISITDSYTLRIFSKEIVEDLISHNILPNKTQNPIYPIVDKELFFDFLRGYIDGDGCIYYNSKKNALAVHITGAHEDVFKYLQSVLYEDYNISSGIYNETDRKYRIMLTGKNAIKLLELIYRNTSAPKLERKYSKYLTIKAAISEHEMKKSGNIGEGLTANTEISERIA